MQAACARGAQRSKISVVVAVMIAVVVMITMLAIAVAVPVTVFMPAALVPFPPSVILVPAAFALFVQLTAPTFCLAAALAVFASRLIEFGLGPFDALAALSPVVSLGARCSGKEEECA